VISTIILILQVTILILLVLSKDKKIEETPKVNRQLAVKRATIPTANCQKRKPIYHHDSVLFDKEQKILRGE
jgi:hypothetical protein